VACTYMAHLFYRQLKDFDSVPMATTRQIKCTIDLFDDIFYCINYLWREINCVKSKNDCLSKYRY